ncbi:MAG: DUF473 domain-containing protein [Methanomicrobiales archaeon]|nr:DUF473 domain-containing protein [Methanomicrobiales archaeon]
MSQAALTGIASQVIAELKRGRPRTLELTSAHNVVTLAGVEPGQHLFMTAVDLDDLSPGDAGIMVDVMAISISMKRQIEFNNPIFFEERERVAARVQVRFCGTSMVKQVRERGMGRATLVELTKTGCYHAV